MLQFLLLIKFFSSNFNSSLTIIHYIIVRMQNIPKVDELKASIGMTIFVNLIIGSVIR